VKLHFLSGLPRSGSTLLTTLLYQNPLIHTEGISGLCDVMWQTHQSFSSSQGIPANRRQSHAHQMVADLPSRYYSDVTRPVVIDKCRTWTSPYNIKMLQHYVTPQPKVIVLTRNLGDIIMSFKSLFEHNGRNDFDTSGIPEEFNRNVACTQAAKDFNDPNMFLFVEFEDLIGNTQNELNRIYKFLDMESFQHDLNNIVTINPEDDSVYGLLGMHDVRRTIGKRDAV
jgi:sulfotransferase